VSAPVYAPRLRQSRPGAFHASAGGHAFEVLLLDGVWVVFADGYEICSAARLAVAESKIADWLVR
jgi:hypothetical protein